MNSKNKFGFNKYGKADVVKVKARLESIRKRRPLNAEAVLEDAAREGSLLHPFFCWDDTIAAQRYRERQARDLIGHVLRIQIVGDDHQDIITREYVHVRIEQESQYVPVEVAMSITDLRQQVLENALRELSNFERKYAHLAELSEVLAAIQTVKQPKMRADVGESFGREANA